MNEIAITLVYFAPSVLGKVCFVPMGVAHRYSYFASSGLELMTLKSLTLKNLAPQ